MDWQHVLVIVIVVPAAVYLGRQTWRTWSGRKKTGCGGGCGCKQTTSTPPGSIIPSEQLSLRRPSP